VRQALAKQQGGRNGHGGAATLRAVLETERAQGLHAPGKLADPSAAVALLWMHRSLAFQHAMLEGLCTNRGSKARRCSLSRARAAPVPLFTFPLTPHGL
jgi:hypothetical protein